MSDGITIRPYQPGDEIGVLRGHNLTFQPQRSLAHWQWKFRDNPTGQVHTMLAVHEKDGIVGAYVTLPVRVLVEGKERLAGQCIDLYVLPEHRRAGPRPGLFVNLALAHYELWGGKQAHQNSFHYGWPIATWRIGQKYLRYEMVRDWDFLFREVPPGGLPPRAVSNDLEVRTVARFDAATDALWDANKGASQLAIVRDAKYLNWRYADALDATYELCECRERRTGALRGIAVLTRRDFLFPQASFLADWLVPAADYDTTLALVAHAEQRANALGSRVLSTLFQHLDPRFLHFQHLGFRVYGTSYFQVVIPFDQQDTLFYKDHWYHTAGDSDLI
ncbi:MAG: GNAT family N-acetyltransferase [Planctomycetota bacterium]|nr:GNAT family N-acetyltransferase [Planctomycetota bacterium]